MTRTASVKHFIDGVPLQDRAKELGMTYRQAYHLLKKYGKLERPIRKEHWHKGKTGANLKIVFEGRKLAEWAAHYGVTYTTVFNRYKQRGTVHPEVRLPKPVQEKVSRDVITVDGKTILEWAEHYGVTRQCIHGRYMKTGTVHPKYKLKKNPSA